MQNGRTGKRMHERCMSTGMLMLWVYQEKKNTQTKTDDLIFFCCLTTMTKKKKHEKKRKRWCHNLLVTRIAHKQKKKNGNFFYANPNAILIRCELFFAVGKQNTADRKLHASTWLRIQLYAHDRFSNENSWNFDAEATIERKNSNVIVQKKKKKFFFGNQNQASNESNGLLHYMNWIFCCWRWMRETRI